MKSHEIHAEIALLLPRVDARLDRDAIPLDDTPFQAYGLTSMATAQLASRIEDRFDIVLTDKDLFVATSMSRLVELVQRLVQARGTAAERTSS
ncbi:acyl carrier protein [Streptomyces sp. NPDC058989]|uniref:acyl carrier protein n=1 Tax=Streptomyces sp. NPDC058989 TaxID=3346686 RepID=UPI003696BE3E